MPATDSVRSCSDMNARDKSALALPKLRTATAEGGEKIEFLAKPSRLCRRRLTLRYDSKLDLPVLTLPYGYDDWGRMEALVLMNRDFIRRERERNSKRQVAYVVTGDRGSILYRGRFLPFAVDPRAKQSHVRQSGNNVEICLALPKMCSREAVDRAMMVFFKAQAQIVLGELMETFRGRASRWPSSWKLSSAKTRWGCCTARNTIRLSWKLLFLDDEIASYVIAHELAHLVHFNHSTEFWGEVERLCPNWRALRARIKTVGDLPDFDQGGR